MLVLLQFIDHGEKAKYLDGELALSFREQVPQRIAEENERRSAERAALVAARTTKSGD